MTQASLENLRRGGFFRFAVSAVLLIIATMITVRYPVMPLLLGALLLSYGLALWRWPSLWLVVIPAILPALDLTPWTGWMLIGEYDLFGLVTVGILLVRAPPNARDFVIGGWPGIAVALSILTYLVGIVLGLTSLLDIPRQSNLLYLRPENALRLANGFVLALALLPFMRERARVGQPVAIWFAAGMVGGLTLVALATIVERALFPGLFDFSADYRVVATFSSMHLGGGHIGAYIAMTLPFLVVFLAGQRRWLLPLMLPIALCAAYALVVTFARTAYVAAAVSMVLVLAGWIVASWQSGRNTFFAIVTPALLVLIVVGLLASAALATGIMSERFTQVAPDLATREENWISGLDIRDNTVSADLLGMGLGTFPRAVLGRRKGGDIPSNFSVEREGHQNFLSMDVAEPFYFDQKVSVAPRETYKISMLVRSPDAKAELTADLCEKLLLYSDNCRGVHFKPKRSGDWEPFTAAIATNGLDEKAILGILRRPVVLSLFDLEPKSTIEIKDISLTDAAGHNVIANGDFSHGVERWFFTDDNHLVWRMKNQYLMILFESGLLGIASFITLIGAALWGALRAMGRGERMGAAIAASLVAFLCSGLFDYLLEAPRIATLFYLVCFLGLTIGESHLRPNRIPLG